MAERDDGLGLGLGLSLRCPEIHNHDPPPPPPPRPTATPSFSLNLLRSPFPFVQQQQQQQHKSSATEAFQQFAGKFSGLFICHSIKVIQFYDVCVCLLFFLIAYQDPCMLYSLNELRQ